MKNKLISSAKIISLFLMIFALSFGQAMAYNAFDLIGQLDGSDNPIYIQGYSNNISNDHGFSMPSGVALDSIGHRLFVADFASERVLVFNLDVNNNLLDYVADNVLGQINFNDFTAVDSSAMATGGSFGIAFDEVHNRLFVADYTCSRVVVFDTLTITDGENAVNVLGQPDFTSCSQGTSASSMTNPDSVAYDSVHDRLFVADGSNSRVLVFDVSSIVDGQNAINVLGQNDFISNSAKRP